eukprot:COSAG01_NODE_26191_length_721_cov_1.215434_2_plen_36_part_01
MHAPPKHEYASPWGVATHPDNLFVVAGVVSGGGGGG